MAFWQWSTTPANNATVDPSVNWAEGQAPSSINDSARAMMARLAEWRNDTQGNLPFSGTATAYTATTSASAGGNPLPNPPPGGTRIAGQSAVTNGSGVTLAVDGGTAYPIQSASGVPIPAASLIANTPYEFVFLSGANVWLTMSFFGNPFITPIGGLIPYVGSSVPNANFAFPFGQAISRTTYATLFSLTGTTFGVGDGSTTFNILDLRGRAIFCLDNGAARITVAGGNIDGTVIGNPGGAQNHTLTSAEMPVHTHGASDPSHNHSHSDPGHNHTLTDPGHAHNLQGATASGFANPTVVEGNSNAATLTGGAISNTTGITLAAAVTGITNTASFTGITINNAGSGSSHTILPPAMVLPYILRII